jgi:hypothetical protein
VLQGGLDARSVRGDAADGSRATGASPLLPGGQLSASVSMGAPETSSRETAELDVQPSKTRGAFSGVLGKPTAKEDPWTDPVPDGPGRLLEGCGAAKSTHGLCTLKSFILKSLGNFLEVSFESLSVAVAAVSAPLCCQTGT